MHTHTRNLLQVLSTYYVFNRKLDLTCSSAAATGQLKTIQYLRTKHNCEWGRSCTEAIEGGHFEVLKWAKENGYEHVYACMYVIITVAFQQLAPF